ncbi:MAG: hypothetical protein Q9223_001582 [Gallowayella weberi]
MTENIPPSTAADSTTRGIPYYEKLKRDLRETIQKKRLLDKNLTTLEDQIYRFESTYLEETSAAGNIIKGFDNYIKGSALSGSISAGGGTLPNIKLTIYPRRTHTHIWEPAVDIRESERSSDAHERDERESRREQEE